MLYTPHLAAYLATIVIGCLVQSLCWTRQSVMTMIALVMVAL